jgi:hypothetical protein
MKTGLVPDEADARLVRCDEIDRTTKRLVKEAEALEGKPEPTADDFVRINAIHFQMQALAAEMRDHHRVLVGAFAPAPRKTLVDRILRR